MNTRENLNIGSIGFAQLGMPDYYEKRKVERKVLSEIIELPFFENKFPDLCRIKIVTERYEDSSYDEVAISYDWRLVDNLEDTDIDRFNQFWEWVNELESFDFESESYINRCIGLYAEEYKLSIAHKNNSILTKAM